MTVRPVSAMGCVVSSLRFVSQLCLHVQNNQKVTALNTGNGGIADLDISILK